MKLLNSRQLYYSSETAAYQEKRTEHKIWMFLISSLLIVASVCYAQIRGSAPLLFVTLFLFLIVSIWASVSGCALAVLLFFLPWSPLLKLELGGISFFTVSMFICSLIALVQNGFQVCRYQVLLTASILLISLIAKIVHGNGITNSFIFFFIMLALFPCLSAGKHEYDFLELTLFFALGIITAALSAQQVVRLGNISKYIKVDSYLTITRLSGYYGDPNFYSAHISACLAGTQILLITEQRKVRRIAMIIIALALIYCGLLSASKTFVIVFACLFFFWILIALEHGNRWGSRFRLLIGIIGAAMIVLLSPRFQDLLCILNDRFSYNANLSQITTGRTDLWLRYVDAFRNDPWLMLLGEGFSAVNVGGAASHNSVIQGVYQFGIVGFPLLIIWSVLNIRSVYENTEDIRIPWKYIILMFIGVGLPWMSLDILFFDEFFLLPVYAIIGGMSVLPDTVSSSPE